MVRSILNGHPKVHLTGETHYFDDLRPRLAERARGGMTVEDRRVCEDYLLAIGHRPYGHEGDPEKSRHTRAALRLQAEAVGGANVGGDAFFQAFCMLEAQREGAEVWGEKTPRHVFRISEILGVFPNAKVVCLVRDARAVVASYRDWKNQGGFDFAADPGHEMTLAKDHERARKSYHPVIISMLWKGAIAASYSALDTFGPQRVRVQHYEHLVDDPEASIRDLAAWVGLDYDPAMQQIPMHNSSYSKFDRAHGVSTAPKERWRTTLSPSEIAVIGQVCNPLLKRAGYDILRPQGVALRAAACWLGTPWAIARAATVNHNRIANMPAYVWRRLKPSSGHRRAARSSKGQTA